MLDIVYLENGSYYSTGELKGSSFFGVENEPDEDLVFSSEAEPVVPAAQNELNENGEY